MTHNIQHGWILRKNNIKYDVDYSDCWIDTTNYIASSLVHIIYLHLHRWVLEYRGLHLDLRGLAPLSHNNEHDHTTGRQIDAYEGRRDHCFPAAPSLLSFFRYFLRGGRGGNKKAFDC